MLGFHMSPRPSLPLKLKEMFEHMKNYQLLLRGVSKAGAKQHGSAWWHICGN